MLVIVKLVFILTLNKGFIIITRTVGTRLKENPNKYWPAGT